MARVRSTPGEVRAKMTPRRQGNMSENIARATQRVIDVRLSDLLRPVQGPVLHFELSSPRETPSDSERRHVHSVQYCPYIIIDAFRGISATTYRVYFTIL